VLGQLPSILSDIAKQKADAGYRQATLAQGQQRIDLSAKNEKRQLANDAFGQWAKTVSLKQGNQRLSMQAAQQQFNQWAKQQGLDVAWANVDLSQRRLAVSQAKASKQSKPTISKTDLRNARSFLFQNRNGYWAYTTDPETPISAAEARRAQALDPKTVIKTGVAEHEDNEIQRIYETLTTKYGIPARRAFDMVANQYKAWGTAHRSAYFPKGSAAQGVASGHTSPVAADYKFGRVDQGVDVSQTRPYVSPGAGVVVRIGRVAGGTNQGVYIRLDQPVTVAGRSYPGIYVWHTSPLVKPGQRVSAGQAIMSAGSAEVGFATADGRPVAPLVGGLGAGTKPTSSGQDMLAWISGKRKV
jgi:hypothetical protein